MRARRRISRCSRASSTRHTAARSHRRGAIVAAIVAVLVAVLAAVIDALRTGRWEILLLQPLPAFDCRLFCRCRRASFAPAQVVVKPATHGRAQAAPPWPNRQPPQAHFASSAAPPCPPRARWQDTRPADIWPLPLPNQVLQRQQIFPVFVQDDSPQRYRGVRLAVAARLVHRQAGQTPDRVRVPAGGLQSDPLRP